MRAKDKLFQVDEIISQNRTSLSVLDSLFEIESEEEMNGKKDCSSDEDLDNDEVVMFS